jgi:hypothetical protein
VRWFASWACRLAEVTRRRKGWRMGAYHIRGELIRDDYMVHGWCWSPARPYERLQVALLIDGVRVAIGVAARLRPHLVRGGICDGYHGFSFALPLPVLPTASIEVQEKGSGHVFGRIIASEAADLPEWECQVERVYKKVATMHERLGAVGGRGLRAPLSSAFGAVGAKLTNAKVAVRDHFADGLRLNFVNNPVATLVLDTGVDAERTVASVRTLAPLLKHFKAELIVTDDGRSAASESLASLPGLCYCFTPVPTGAARANRAARAARAQMLVFLRAGESSSHGVAALLEYASGQQGILIGGLAAATAQHAGLGSQIPLVSAPVVQTGLSLLTPRETFVSLGLFDLAVEDNVDLPVLEFAFRARAAGIDVACWSDLVVRMPQPGANAARAREHFASLWDGRDLCRRISVPHASNGIASSTPATSSADWPVPSDLL